LMTMITTLIVVCSLLSATDAFRFILWLPSLLVCQECGIRRQRWPRRLPRRHSSGPPGKVPGQCRSCSGRRCDGRIRPR
jgi:hypothetical protein